MKQLYTILLLLACLSWGSCGSDDKGKTFQVKMSVWPLGEVKEYTLKEFADPTDNITIVSTQPDWVSVDYYTNTDDQLVVVVSVDENIETTARQHQLMMNVQNGNQFILDITQSAPQFFEVELEFAGKGEAQSITLANLTPPVVITEGLSDWLKMEWKSETSRDVTITANANPSGDERSAQVILKDSQGNHTTLLVKQHPLKDNTDDSTDQTTDQEAL